jgi:hypothetical protein
METNGIYEAVVSFEWHPQSRRDRLYTCKHAIVVASHPRSANMAMQQACLFFFVWVHCPIKLQQRSQSMSRFWRCSENLDLRQERTGDLGRLGWMVHFPSRPGFRRIVRSGGCICVRSVRNFFIFFLSLFCKNKWPTTVWAARSGPVACNRHNVVTHGVRDIAPWATAAGRRGPRRQQACCRRAPQR